MPASHPYHRFGWGDSRSLVDNPTKDQVNMANGQSGGSEGGRRRWRWDTILTVVTAAAAKD
eukprot:6181147-Pleurochrysis_carterae.AAC.2